MQGQTPVSAAPQPAPAGQYYQTQPVVVQQAAAPKAPFFSPGKVTVIALIGIMLFFVGFLVLSSTIFLNAPDYDDYTDYDDYQAAQDSYTDTLTNMYGGGRLILIIGTMFTTLALMGGALSGEGYETKMRAVMIGAAVSFMVVAFVMISLFVSFSVY